VCSGSKTRRWSRSWDHKPRVVVFPRPESRRNTLECQRLTSAPCRESHGKPACPSRHSGELSSDWGFLLTKSTDLSTGPIRPLRTRITRSARDALAANGALPASVSAALEVSQLPGSGTVLLRLAHGSTMTHRAIEFEPPSSTIRFVYKRTGQARIAFTPSIPHTHPTTQSCLSQPKLLPRPNPTSFTLPTRTGRMSLQVPTCSSTSSPCELTPFRTSAKVFIPVLYQIHPTHPRSTQ